MAVREDQAIGCEEHARAGAATGLDLYDGGTDRLDRVNDRGRIRIEQLGIVWLRDHG